jgi:SpoOM protein
MIRIDLSEPKVRNGERLKGSVNWRAEGSKTPRSIEVVCRWRTSGKADREHEIEAVRVDSPAAETVIPFDFAIPLEGPLSYSGKLIRITWEIAVKVDLPMARDEHDAKPFDVVARRWDPKDWVEPDDDNEDLDAELDEEEDAV